MLRPNVRSFLIPDANEFLQFEWRVDNIQGPCVVIGGLRGNDRSTFYGSPPNTPLILRRDEIRDLPHDLIHMLYSLEPQSKVPGSMMSPDVLYLREDGSYRALEITTRRSMDYRTVQNAIEEKLQKYMKLLDEQKLEALNVLVVTPESAHLAYGTLSVWSEQQCLRAFRFGRMIQEEFWQKHGHDEIDSDVNLSRLRDKFLKFTFSDPRFDVDEVSPVADELYLRMTTYKKEYKSFKQFIGERLEGVEFRTVCHLPFPVVEVGPFKSAEFATEYPDHPMVDIWLKGLADYSYEPERDFRYLAARSEMNDGDKQRIDKSLLPDEFRIQLEPDQRLYLAQRGVMAKDLDSQQLNDKHLNDKMPFSFNGDTTPIADYLSSESFDHHMEIPELDMMDYMMDRDGPANLSSVFKRLNRTDIIARARVLEMIAVEAVANCTRNPKDKGDHKNFIIRPLHGIKAAVMIRTTRGNDLEAPIFCSLLWEGPSKHFDGVFERAHQWSEGKWFTEFFSLSREECSQLQGLPSRILSFWGYLVDMFTQDELGPYSQISHFKKVYRELLWLVLIFLQDKQETSEILMSLRYYYMHLLTGTEEAIPEAQKVTNKWPEVLRNPLSIHIIKNLAIVHESIRLENIKVLRTQEKVSLASDEEESINDNPTVPITDLLADGITSFTGFHIKTAHQLLHFAYLGNLKNKDKSSGVSGIMKILNKSAKIGQRYLNLFGRDSRHSDHISPSTDPFKIKEFQHSGPSVSLGAHLMKKRLMEMHSIRDWNSFVEREILLFSLSTMLSELCTNKASTIPFDTDFRIHIDNIEQDLKSFGVRRRVYDALYRMRGQLKEPRAALNLDQFVHTMKVDEGNRLQVTMFKKNQIGGVREIYVLTLTGRVLVRIYSDFFRKIASMHPSEKLTNEQSRDYFVAEHMRKVHSELKGKYRKHINISADMTSWAQLFTMYEFQSMNLNLLPPSLRAFGSYVLSLEKDKILQLPREAVSSFSHSYIRMARGEKVQLSSDGTEGLRRQFIGMEKGLIRDPFSPYVELQNDMMMGILHYPSTVYHLLALEVLESMLKSWAKGRGVDIIVSFQVSSDDEGIMLTIASNDPKLVAWRQKQLMDEYHHIKSSVDKLFGLQTSFEKTSLSIQPIIEFNSKFNLGQTIVCPLIKFVSRAVDDNPSDSLHKRVSSLYTQIKAVRENGATGYLCHYLMMCQALMYLSNLGLGRCPWATVQVFQELWIEKVSYLGFYKILNPFCAGIMGLNYVNWESAVHNPNALKICFLLGSYAIPDDMDALDTVLFGIANTSKYKGILRDLNLEGVRVSDIINENNFESFLRKSRTIDEELLKMQRIILSPGMATSLGKRTRSDTMRQSIYLLYTAFCREREGENKITLHTFRKRLLERPINPSIESVFPMSNHFAEVKRTVTSSFAVAIKDSRQRTRIHWVSSQYNIADSQKDIKDVIRWKWFDLPVRLSVTQLKSYWAELKLSIPWLRGSLKETLSARGYPFKDLHQLMSFFEGYSKTAYPQKMIVRGIIGRSLHPVLDLMRDNTSESCSFTTQSLSEVQPSAFYKKIDFGLLQRTMEIDDRISAWLEILDNVKMSADNQIILDTMKKDLDAISKIFKWDKLTGVSTGQADRDDSLWRLGAAGAAITINELFRNSRFCTIYKNPQSRLDNGNYMGPYECYRRINGIPYHITFNGDQTRVLSPVDEYTASSMVGKLKNPVYIRADVGALPEVKLLDLVIHKNSWYLASQKKKPEDSIYYMSLPRGAPQPHHLKMKGLHNNFLELWLSRQKPEGDAWRDYMDLYTESPGFVKAINAAVDNYYRSSRIKRIFERSGPTIVEENASLPSDDAILALADDLMEKDAPPMLPWNPKAGFIGIQEEEERHETEAERWYAERIQEFIEDFADEYEVQLELEDDSDQFQVNYEERFIATNLMNDMYKTLWAMMQSAINTPDDFRSLFQKVLLYK